MKLHLYIIYINVNEWPYTYTLRCTRKKKFNSLYHPFFCHRCEPTSRENGFLGVTKRTLIGWQVLWE